MLAEEYADPDIFLRVYLATGPSVSAIRTRLSAATLKRMDLTKSDTVWAPTRRVTTVRPNSVTARSTGVSLLLDKSR